MKEQSYVITSPEGLHARPSGFLVKKAAVFESDIQLSCNGKMASAKKLLSIMKLGVKKGDTVLITVEGIDEDSAMQEVISFFNEHF